MALKTRIDMKGLSDLTSVTIFIGLAIVLSLLFIIYTQTYYTVSPSVVQILQSERASVNVRLVSSTNEYFTLLFRRTDGYSRVRFFMYSPQGPVDCDRHIYGVSGGEILDVRTVPLDDLLVVHNTDVIGSFRYYLKSKGYTESSSIKICTLEVSRNTVVVFRTVLPVAEGLNTTKIYAENLDWTLLGVLEFKLVDESIIYINGTRYTFPGESLIKLAVTSKTGTLHIEPISAKTALIREMNLSYTAVYVNGALISTNGVIHLYNTNVYMDSLTSSLSIEITPRASGNAYIRVEHGGSVILDRNTPVYVKVSGIGVNASTPLVVKMDGTKLEMKGLSYFIYVSETPHPELSDFAIFIVVEVNNKVYIVNEYRYTRS